MTVAPSHKHTLRSVLLIFATAFVVFFTSFFIAPPAYAEGSAELNDTDDEANAYRAFLEWDESASNGGIDRVTVLKLIMKQGEWVCLGTSVSGAPNGDILIRCQIDGKETSLSVNPTTKEGQILNRKMELAGPNYDGTITDGYKPLKFQAPYTGVYELEFHSNCTTNDRNPQPMQLNKPWGRQAASVAAWDATVLGYDGKPVEGRLFTNYIALNTGTDKVGMYSSLHILTTEGYQYNIETNGIGPYGFIMYANNVGMLNGLTGQSLYKNITLKTNTWEPQGGVIVPTPDWHNKMAVLTHRIFFNDPDDEITTILSDFPITPAPLPEITKFEFVGNMDDGDQGSKTAVGAGGVFHITFSEHATYDIIIDTNGDGQFNPLEDVMLPAPAAKGENILLWDGKDIDGNPLPAKAEPYKAQIRVHGGEFHFPMIDAERCPAGLKINLVNPPAFLPAGYDTTTVYFDTRNFRAYDNSYIEFDKADVIGVPPVREALNGISSRNGAMGYGTVAGGGNTQFGNDRILDIWSYVLGDQTDSRYVRTLDIQVLNDTGSTPHGSIMATVFFDGNHDGTKQSSEKTMEGVRVGLYKDAAGTVPVKDHNDKAMVSVSSGGGQVSFFDVPYNDPGEKYYLIPDPVVGGVTHTVTTPQRSVTLNKSNAFVDNIGLYTAHDVAVSVTADSTALLSGDEITFTVTVTNTKTDYAANNTTVKLPVPEISGEPEVLSISQGTYANGKWTVDRLPPSGSATITIKMRPVFPETVPGTTEEDVTYTATASCDDDDDATNDVRSVTFKVRQRPEYQIIYHANYQPDGATPEATATEDRNADDGRVALRTNTFARPDYNFLGWSEFKDIARVDYADGDLYRGAGGSVIHLYAVWGLHAPDVTVSISAAPTTITAGETTVLTVTVKNLQTDPAKGTFVEIPFPNIEGSPVVEGVTPDTAYNAATKTWRWQPGTLAGNGEVSCQIRVMPVFHGGTANTTESFTAQTGCTYDTDANNNTASASVTVEPANGYTVRYEPNGGEGTAEDETLEYTTGGKPLKRNQFVRAGYTFLGWSTDPDATTPEFTDEEVHRGDADSSTTLYAVWMKIPDTAGEGASAAGGSGQTGGTNTATGDPAQTDLWWTLLLLSAGGIVCTNVCRKNRRAKELR